MYITFYFILTLLNLLVVILGLFRNASNASDIDAILIRMFSQNISITILVKNIKLLQNK